MALVLLARRPLRFLLLLLPFSLSRLSQTSRQLPPAARYPRRSRLAPELRRLPQFLPSGQLPWPR